MAVGSIITTIIAVAMLVLNSIFLYYTYELQQKGCTCALTWQRKFMEVTLFLFIIINVLNIVGWNYTSPWIKLFMVLVTVAYVVVTRQFIQDVKNKQCTCADTRAYDVLNVVNYIQIALLVISLVLLVFSMIFISTAINKLSSPPTLGPRRAAAPMIRRRR